MLNHGGFSGSTILNTSPTLTNRICNEKNLNILLFTFLILISNATSLPPVNFSHHSHCNGYTYSEFSYHPSVIDVFQIINHVPTMLCIDRTFSVIKTINKSFVLNPKFCKFQVKITLNYKIVQFLGLTAASCISIVCFYSNIQ